MEIKFIFQSKIKGSLHHLVTSWSNLKRDKGLIQSAVQDPNFGTYFHLLQEVGQLTYHYNLGHKRYILAKRERGSERERERVKGKEEEDEN